MSLHFYRTLNILLAREGLQSVSDEAAAAHLNTQRVAAPRAFTWDKVKSIALTAGCWANVVVFSRRTPALPPSTSADVAILASINAVSMLDVQEIDPTNETAWATFLGGLQAMVASSVIPQDVANQIEALAGPEMSPAEEAGLPPVTDADVNYARNLPNG